MHKQNKTKQVENKQKQQPKTTKNKNDTKYIAYSAGHA